MRVHEFGSSGTNRPAMNDAVAKIGTGKGLGKISERIARRHDLVGFFDRDNASIGTENRIRMAGKYLLRSHPHRRALGKCNILRKIDDRPWTFTAHRVSIVRSRIREGFVVGACQRSGENAAVRFIEASVDCPERSCSGPGNESGLSPLQQTVEAERARVVLAVPGEVGVVVHVLMLTRIRAASDGTRITTITDL